MHHTFTPLARLFLLALLLAAASCRDKDCFDSLNPDCVNYDPCPDTEFRTSADFGFWDRPISSLHYLPFRDTLLYLRGGGKRVYFRAKDPRMSSYTWKVGTDPREFRDSVFFLEFYDITGWINVTLIAAHAQANAACFPGDNGLDTVQKAFYLQPVEVNSWEEIEPLLFPIFGSYLGHDEHTPQDTFVVEIKQSLSVPAGIYNLPQGCSSLRDRFEFNSHHFLIVDEDSPQPRCDNPNIFGSLQSDNRTLIIEYSFLEGGQRVHRRWVGSKQ